MIMVKETQTTKSLIPLATMMMISISGFERHIEAGYKCVYLRTPEQVAKAED